MKATFNNLFQKKWFYRLFIAMLILLIVETSVIIFLIVVSGLGTQAFPALDLNYYATPGCSALTAQVVSSTIDNRTVEYNCPPGGAINIKPGFPTELLSRWGPGPANLLVIPTFSLPKGYLRLAIVDRRMGCATNQLADYSHFGQILLRSGQNMTLGGGFADIYGAYGGWSYDYCSVIAGQTGRVDGFRISWREIPWPKEFVKITASSVKLVVPSGQNASSVVTVTALGYFSGNVTFGYQASSVGYLAPLYPTQSITPSVVFLTRGGSKTVTVTVTTYPGTVPQTYNLDITAYPGPGTAPGYTYSLRTYIRISVSIV